MNQIVDFFSELPQEIIVSDLAVIEKNYQANVTALERQIPLVLRPTNEADVQRILLIAQQHQLKVYPFSTGKNWGLGSKLPVQDQCILLDLSGMNRIIEVNPVFGYAIIEPGVTQLQLAEYLSEKHPSLSINFTGSFAYTSILGNVLERGDGLYARVNDLLGMRGLLADGTAFEVGGLWQNVGTGHPSHYSKYLAGPDLTGLFMQSSMGVITQIAFRLLHQTEHYYYFWGTASDANLEKLMDTFTELDQKNILSREIVGVGYANRFLQAKSTLLNQAPEVESVWHYCTVVRGSKRITAAIIEELHEYLAPLSLEIGAFCRETDGDPYEHLPEFMQALIPQLRDRPDTSSIEIIYKMTNTPLPDDPQQLNADLTPFGMKSYIPMIPFQGRYARQAATIVRQISQDLGLNIKLSFGDDRGLITIHFRRDDPRQIELASQGEKLLWEQMLAAGFPPYRVSIDQMERLMQSRPEFFQLVERLKSTLDPDHTIAPGRYSPC